MTGVAVGAVLVAVLVGAGLVETVGAVLVACSISSSAGIGTAELGLGVAVGAVMAAVLVGSGLVVAVGTVLVAVLVA